MTALRVFRHAFQSTAKAGRDEATVIVLARVLLALFVLAAGWAAVIIYLLAVAIA